MLLCTCKLQVRIIIIIICILSLCRSIYSLRQNTVQMLPKQQKLLLAQRVRDNKAVVLAPFPSTVTKQISGMDLRKYALNLMASCRANI